QSPGAKFAVTRNLSFLQDPEGLGGVVGSSRISGIEYVAQLIAGEAVLAGEEGIELGAKRFAAVFVPPKGRPTVAEIFSPGPHRIGGKCELKDTRRDEGDIVSAEVGGGEYGKLLCNEKIQVGAPDLMAGAEIECQTAQQTR